MQKPVWSQERRQAKQRWLLTMSGSTRGQEALQALGAARQLLWTAENKQVEQGWARSWSALPCCRVMRGDLQLQWATEHLQGREQGVGGMGI